ELEVEERALALAAGVVRRAEGEPARAIGRSRAHRELAHAARVELAARFRERLGLADLAAPLGVSVFHLCRVFKEEFGAPLHAFRRSLRVRAALRELFVPGRTLYDVAEAAGFSDRTQLHRAFRRTLGVSPSALRRRSTGRSS
ncbi:MAG: helix-turn-helix transcriptional regulator, partial [Planctomycetota bacterium JB042]